ncbi:phasin family protein [Dyella sp.]|uniref:phasin family protein n=1 Tax=Dyella sp. TaxID=1869338 RepID=UPI002D774B7B|nr:phasin family protein [Dyella sp.]HET7332632.1 phasin family protein [Dyella sp.]
MTTQNDIPFELYKANLQFTLRTNKLLKECGQRWLDTFDHAVGESIAESQEEIDKLSLDDNWQSLAAVPGETLVRLMQERVGDAQAVAQAAVTNQTRFLTGLQDAFLMWQRDTAKAMGSVEAAKPFNAALGDFFKLFANATTMATGSGHEH